MDYKKFFLENNKAGLKTRESYIIKNHNEIHQIINEYCDNINLNGDISFKEKVYIFVNNLTEVPICKNCGVKLKFKKSLREGYGSYCSIKCTNQHEEHKNNVKETFNRKYGGSPIRDKDIKKKIEQTNLERYGVTNIFKDSEYIKSKTKDKLGVTNPNQLNSVVEKRKSTNLNKYGVTNTLLLDDSRKNNHSSKLINFNEKYKGLNVIDDSGDYVKLKCNDCNKEYDIDRSLLFYRFKNKINPCTICNTVSELKSIKEKEVIDFLSSLGLNLIKGDRDILNGKEIDILIPDFNIGIEFNGLYWHCEKYVDKDYHLNKTNVCESKGIHLIHIFEDEWVNNKDIVKSRLKNLFKLTENKVYGRKCIIKEVNTKDKTKFLNDNHIQGTIGSKVNLGLYYNDELVSIMTFGKGRVVMNGVKNEWELLRFCNKINHSVIGGASKLFKHFIKNYKPNQLISYADRRWSQGNLYDQLGFNKTHNSTPNYFYVVNNEREHRFKYRKNLLVEAGFDIKKTEREIMYDRGIYRIYDCGNLVYIYNNKEISL
jgi:hypothetical protein